MGKKKVPAREVRLTYWCVGPDGEPECGEFYLAGAMDDRGNVCETPAAVCPKCGRTDGFTICGIEEV